MEYFRAEPASRDAMWIMECASVYDWTQGRGIDVGAGGRTLDGETLRVELFADHCPHVRARAQELPFRDGALDFAFSCHAIEHMPDPIAVLREWLRVVKVGGHVASVVPDTRFTRGQNTDRTPHFFEWGPRDFLRLLGIADDGDTPWFKVRGPVPVLPEAELVYFGEGCPQWSFSFALERRA